VEKKHILCVCACVCVYNTTYSAHEKCAAITWRFISIVPTQLLSMREGKINKMTTAATIMTRNMEHDEDD